MEGGRVGETAAMGRSVQLTALLSACILSVWGGREAGNTDLPSGGRRVDIRMILGRMREFHT